MFKRAAQCLHKAAGSLLTPSSPGALATGGVGLWPQALAKAVQHTLSAGAHILGPVRSKYTYAFKRAAATPGLIFWKPRTNGLRHRISIDYKALGVYTGPPIEQLSQHVANSGGRNSHGHLTARGRGGGMKRLLRDVDFKQEPELGKGVVERVELDPFRTGFLALVRYDKGLEPGDPRYTPEYKYHVAPHGLREGDVIGSGQDVAIRPGNRLKLRDVPLGTPVHNMELVPGAGGVLVRAAGVSASIKFKDERYAVVNMPSGEVRRIELDCCATIGSVSNPLNKLTSVGKAGINRQRGRRPKVRGVAMNAVDHPHGGKTAGGRPSCSPWGVYAKGQRTRLRNKWSNRLIITRKGGIPIEKFVQAKKWRAAAERDRRLKSGASMPQAAAGPPEHLLGPRPPAWGTAVISVLKVSGSEGRAMLRAGKR